MEQKVVLKEENRCIFYLNDGKVNFYIVIPRTSKVSLAISIFDSVSMDTLKNIPNIVDKAIIVPLFDINYLNNISSGNMDYYLSADNLLSMAVNISYRLLKFNNIEVNNKIIMDYNEKYSSFSNWYVSKYRERVELFNLGIHKSFVEPQPVNVSNTVQEVANVTTTNNVSGEEGIDKDDEIVKEASPGFVSYVLLGVIVAVVSLVIMYMLI